MRDSVRINRPVALLVVIAFACVSTAVYAQNTNAPANQPFTLTIATEMPSVKSGSSVWVAATVQNKSEHGVTLHEDESGDQGGFVYRVEVWDMNGKPASETKAGRQLQGHTTKEEDAKEAYVILESGGEFVLEPGKAATDRVNVSKLYDLNRPGRYTIQLKRYDLESKTTVSSNQIILIVTP